MQNMRDDNYQMNEQFMDLRSQLEKLQGDYDRDKAFYEEALEARMNQLEQAESENDSLKSRMEDQRRREVDL